MKLTALGRVIFLILVAGIAFGGYRWYKEHPKKTGNGTTAAVPHFSSSSGPESPGTGRSGTALTLVTSATKKGWLENEVERFNTAKGGAVHIEYQETRTALQKILNKGIAPALWSPSSPVWATRLSDAWQERHGTALVDASEPTAYRVYLRTPIVFLTTKRKAGYLRPLLNGSGAWQNLADLSSGKKRLPGATRRFVWAHADPLNANSGFLTLGLILDSYVQAHSGMSPEAAASSAGFANYLQQVEKGLPVDAAVRGGSSALMQAFLQDPERYDVITTYESSALEAMARHADLAVLYPGPTAVSEQTVAVLQGDWVTSDQKQEAAELLTFLGSEDSLRDGVVNHFRPVRETGTVSLAPEIDRYRANGFQQTFTSVELPPYAALNAAARTWYRVIAKSTEP